MLDEKLVGLLQAQFTLERENAAAYEQLSSVLAYSAWNGAAAYMQKSADDEVKHSRMVRDYLIDRNQMPQVALLDAPDTVNGDDMIDYFEAALTRETLTTEALSTLYAAAKEDVQTLIFLHPMILEQTSSTREIQDIIKVISTDSDPLVIDQWLAGKV